MSLLEHRRNEEILEEAKVEHIVTVMRRRRLEWFGHVKRRNETDNIRAVVEMKMEGKRPRGRPTLMWNDTSAASEAQHMRCTPTGGITSWDWSHVNRVNL